MKFTPLEIAGLVLVELKLFGDSRGFFVERFQEARFKEAGLPTHFAQDNHSRSAPTIIRGLHYQHNPAQGKLVSCISGQLWDVAVDIRADSPSFGQHFGLELSGENGLMLWIPPGFAHGFLSLQDDTELLYKCTDFYSAQAERSLIWNDPDIGIAWPLNGIGKPLLSDKDAAAKTLAEAEVFA